MESRSEFLSAPQIIHRIFITEPLPAQRVIDKVSAMATPGSQQKVTHRGWVTTALLLSMFMTAIEITIVATAMPRIVADLGGFALLSWVFSAYLLTQVVSIPIYGKLADLYGRKPVYLSGILLFMIASILCGQSQSMVQLIGFRFLQGLGGGAVQPIAMTIVGDLYRPHERHRIQGMAGSIFAISSLIGPVLGAFIVDLGHWAWIFYVNVPLGVVAIALIWAYLHEEPATREHKIDFGGAVILVGATSALMLGLLEGGSGWPWWSWQSLACLGVFLGLGGLLLIVENRVKEPILPLWIFRKRLIRVAGAATFVNGAMMIGYSAMVPTHVQGSLGRTPMVAGLTLATMSIGWPLASFLSGRIMARIGYRRAAMAGAASMFLGSTAIFWVARWGPVPIAVAMFFVGAGLGLQSNAYIITIQSSVSWRERGVATANNLFMRTLGSSVGVAAFGGILNSTISGIIRDVGLAPEGGHGLNIVNQLLSPDVQLPATDRLVVIQALSQGMDTVFLIASFVSLGCLFITTALPKRLEGGELYAR